MNPVPQIKSLLHHQKCFKPEGHQHRLWDLDRQPSGRLVTYATKWVCRISTTSSSTPSSWGSSTGCSSVFFFFVAMSIKQSGLWFYFWFGVACRGGVSGFLFSHRLVIRPITCFTKRLASIWISPTLRYIPNQGSGSTHSSTRSGDSGVP